MGVIVLPHGWQKLSVGPANFGERALVSLGVPLPVFMAYVVTFVELIGGLLLIIGLFSRLAALLLTIDLVVAFLFVHLPQGFGEATQFDLSLIAGFLAILLAGPGRFSLDYRLLGYERDVVAERTTRSSL